MARSLPLLVSTGLLEGHPQDPDLRVFDLQMIGCTSDGGFADYVAVPAEKVVSLPAQNDRGAYVLSRYPVLKIHHTVTRHMARKVIVRDRLTPTPTSAIP